MHLLARLLRLLLCVTLVANGAGFAHASARMQLMHAGQEPRAVAEVGKAAHITDAAGGIDSSACHGRASASDAGGPAAATAHGSMVHAATGTSADGHPPAVHPHGDGEGTTTDCCDAGARPGACKALSSTAVLAAVWHGPRFAPAVRTMDDAPQRASPRLPHLIRPPIG